MKKDYQSQEQKIEKKLKEIKDKTTNSKKTQSSFNPLRISELMSKDFPELQWLVQNLIPTESTTAVSGSLASFKTWVVLEMALRIAKGETLFNNFTTKKTGILIIDEENGERLLQHRLKKLNKLSDHEIYLLSIAGFKVSDKSTKDILTFAKKNDVKLVIFDSLVRIHEAYENAAIPMAKVFSFFKQLNKEGIGVMFTHHNRKAGAFKSFASPSQEMRGSSDILASVDCHLTIERKTKEQITVTQTKLRHQEEMSAFTLNIIEENEELTLEYGGNVDPEKTKREVCQDAILSLLEIQDKELYKKEAFKILTEGGLRIGWSTFKKVVDAMVKEKIIYERKGEGNKVFIFLKQDSQEF